MKLEAGQEYWLGYPFFRPGGVSSGERIATYIGVHGGQHVFVAEHDGKKELYTCPAKEKGACPIEWFGDAGDDEPCSSAPAVSFYGYPNEKEQKQLEEILAALKK